MNGGLGEIEIGRGTAFLCACVYLSVCMLLSGFLYVMVWTEQRE